MAGSRTAAPERPARSGRVRAAPQRAARRRATAAPRAARTKSAGAPIAAVRDTVPSSRGRQSSQPLSTRRKVVGGLLRVAAAPFAVFRGLVRGDRPLIIGVLGALVAAGLLLIGPVERYLESQERVERLAVTADILDREVGQLEQRIDDLHDPRHIELLAREQQGFIRPGEIPFRIVPPPVDQPNVLQPVRAEAPEPPWYQQWWDVLQRWIGTDGQLADAN